MCHRVGRSDRRAPSGTHDPDRDPVWRKRRRENLPMYFLAIETTGAFASVALLEDDRVLEHIQGHDRFSHLQNLMPQVKEVLENHKLSINDVETIAVSKGPGSFTGIRIGVSSARALCQVLGIPGVPVSSLEALAMRVGRPARRKPAKYSRCIFCKGRSGRFRHV